MPSPDTEEFLVSELFDSWYSRLVGYVARTLGNIELAEDLVQEAFLQLFRELKAGAKIEHPKGWTLCVVRHQISKHLRATKDRGIVFEPLDESSGIKEFRYFATDPFEQTTKSFSGLMSLLTRREEEIVLLRLEGFKYKEIASQLNIKSSSIKTLIARAIRKLREAMEAPCSPSFSKKENSYETR